MMSETTLTTPRELYHLLGHKGRVFDLRVYENDSIAVSAGEDSKVVVWDLSARRTRAILQHEAEFEVLRACNFTSDVLVSCCSNGKASIWHKAADGQYSLDSTVLDHDGGQIYACEASNILPRIITAADNVLRAWDMNSLAMSSLWTFDELPSNGNASSFGGPRNPDNIVYIFDAKLCSFHEGIVAMAMSDGTARLLDMRLNSQSILCPPSPTHATSVTWTATGDALLLCLGDGDIGLLDLRMNKLRTKYQSHSRCCFGTAPYDDNRFISWSSDGTLRLWDLRFHDGVVSSSQGLYQLKDYPIYSCAIMPSVSNAILCAGGSSSSTSFLGNPIKCLQPFDI